MPTIWWLLLVATAAIIVSVALWQPTRAAAREARFHRARRHFRLRREWLEARFVRAAAQRAQSNVVHWSDCEFDDGVAYVRNRTSGELSAFVEVSVPVEEPYGGRGSGLEPGASRRVGTAIFRFDRNHWQTDGRALLNLNPSEAILYYHEDLEVIGPQSANQAQ